MARRAPKPIKDNTGRRFGHLVILYLLERDEIMNRHTYMCQCDCGTQRVANLHKLWTGTKCCGSGCKMLRDAIKNHSQVQTLKNS